MSDYEKIQKTMNTWERFLTSLEFELFYKPSDDTQYFIPEFRDEEDIPILVSLVINEPDLFITGDQDFHTDDIK